MPVNINQHWTGRHFVADLSAIVWLLLAIGLWLVPLFKTGAKFGPVKWLPRHVTYLHGCAGLFTMREASWGQAIYLVKREDASAWVEMDRDWVSPMPVAGYRQRLDRVFGEVRRERIYPQIYSGMAAYVARRAGELAPELPKVTEVRFINTSWSTKDAYMNDPSGRWRLLPWQELGRAHTTSDTRFALADQDGAWRILAPVKKKEPGTGTVPSKELPKAAPLSLRPAPPSSLTKGPGQVPSSSRQPQVTLTAPSAGKGSAIQGPPKKLPTVTPLPAAPVTSPPAGTRSATPDSKSLPQLRITVPKSTSSK